MRWTLEDVAQETFIKAFRNLSAFRGESKFSTWLISIGLNEARSQLRRQAAIQIVSLDELQGNTVPASLALLRDWRELPSDVVEREEIRKLFEQAIEMLPNTYRQVFLLRDIEGRNGNNTAQVLNNISTSLAKVRLHRARMMLQRLLAPKWKAIHSTSQRICF